MIITKDDYGLIQLWKTEPNRFLDKAGKYIWGSTSEVGIEINKNLTKEEIKKIDKKEPIFISL